MITMEMVTEYLHVRYSGNHKPLPFPEYLLPQNRHKNDFWVTEEGECIYPVDMESRHLLNTVRLIHRNNPVIKDRYRQGDGDEHILYGQAPWDVAVKIIKVINARSYYFDLWKNHRIYMLLRREIKIRQLEDQL
jgi:hypothetical protein